ncbi:hypothetical protein FB382_000504 [Nocardioides ginsengisegetis]|uniref:PknH-like extracellular domain-containing protein n=1 Tax=Nocardioides ginsengisegetis TaxID=661491 RepID=A0A7W3P898_9ACTN|nr:hypothetical protein [Nocardioides ginsengisegetis]MBA8802213.1 hypothetical protein [Nocardioides ginsengisegetis]
MSDPFEELRHLQQGIDVNPLPASEVRRRGDRMRRRNTAVAVAGGIAAIALVAVPLSIAAGGSNHSAPQPGPATTSPSASADAGAKVSWRQSIPADFPLTQGFPKTNGNDGSPVTVQKPTDVEVFPPCLGYGTQRSAPAPTADRASVTYLGESEDRREAVLAVYDDEDAAIAAMQQLEDDVAGCPSQTHQGTTYLFDAVPSDYGDQSFTWIARVEQGGELSSELTVVQNVRVGNAIHALSYYGAGGATQQVIDYTRQLMATDSAPVLSDLCIFAANPCAEPPQGATAIPADFPILDGYPEDSQAESESYGRSGPDTAQPALRLEACGTKSPAPEATATLTGGWTNPEDFRTRQLVTFATPAAAAAWVRSLTGLWADCPEEQTSDGYTTVRTVLEGEEHATLVTQYRQQGGFTPGLMVTTLVQRGNAVLLSETYNEGGAGQHPDQEVNFQVDEGLSSVQGIVDAMCLYIDRGC